MSYQKDRFGRNLDYRGMPINPFMGMGRYQDALRRLAMRISAGEELRYEDSNETGNKHTICSWGLCSNDPEQWPDADDHIWPDQFTEEGRIAPRYLRPEQTCPMKGTGRKGHGCFYSCKVFQGNPPSRLEAMDLVDKHLEQVEALYGRKTAADDEEPWVKKSSD